MCIVKQQAGKRLLHPFDALAEGGSVFMPLEPTFWSPCFDMCSDRFGVHWMVGLDGPLA
jgi:PhnB protein